MVPVPDQAIALVATAENVCRFPPIALIENSIPRHHLHRQTLILHPFREIPTWFVGARFKLESFGPAVNKVRIPAHQFRRESKTGRADVRMGLV